jgi:hypothetical protein
MSGQILASVCILPGALFIVLAVVFSALKEKGAMLISGFNTLSKEKRDTYDKKRMSGDMRNLLLIWGGVLLIGGLLSYFISWFFGGAAIVLWLALLLKEIRLDPEKAFEKYKR